MENNSNFIYVFLIFFIILFLFEDDDVVEDTYVQVTVQTEKELVTSENETVYDTSECQSNTPIVQVTKSVPPSDSLLSTLDINWDSYVVNNGVIQFIDNPTIIIKEGTSALIKRDKKLCLFIDGNICNNIYTLKSLHTTESGKVNAIMNMYNYRVYLPHDKSLVQKIISTRQKLEYDVLSRNKNINYKDDLKTGRRNLGLL